MKTENNILLHKTERMTLELVRTEPKNLPERTVDVPLFFKSDIKNALEQGKDVYRKILISEEGKEYRVLYFIKVPINEIIKIAL